MRSVLPIATVVILCTVGTASDAWAQSYRVRSISIGRAASYMRADLTTGAPRTFTQGLSLRGYDLAGDGTGSMSLYLSVRYGTDFGLPAELRDDPWTESEWNELALDAAWLRWRPYRGVVASAGRQATFDAAGWRDFDGLRLAIHPEIGRAALVAEAWGGAEVVHRSDDRFGQDNFDVQGLPPNDPFRGGDGPGFIGGSRAGIAVDDASFELSWSRRHYQDSSDWVLGSEVVGAAMSLSPVESITVASRASYQTVIAKVDHAETHVAWALPDLASVATIGVEQRLPWFDSGSIWNVFGAQPHQGLYASYQLDLAPIRQAIQLNGWGRIYHGDIDSTDFGSSDDDARMVGTSVVHRADFSSFGLPWSWRGLVSGQWTAERAQGGDQYLADARLGAHVARGDAFLYSRGIGAWVRPSATSRFGDGVAITGLIGLEWEVAFGAFGAALDLTHAEWRGESATGYVTFEVEQWR